MNQFKFIIDNDNMAMTPVENIFINHYMPRARGDYVKVYLFGLKHCFNQSLEPIDNLALSKLFDLTEGDVIKAWEYWEKEGILSLEYVGTKDVIVTYYNISAKLMSHHTKTESETKKTETPQRQDPDSMEARVAHMYSKIQQMYGSRTITQKETQMFKNWITEYHFTPETVILLVEYSMNLIGKKEKPFTAKQIINYLKSVAEGWYKADIREATEADAYIRKSAGEQKLVYDVFKYLGLRRAPIAWEKEMIIRWADDYHFDSDIITAAMQRSSKQDIRYIDAILKRWSQKGYTSLEEINAEPKKGHHQSKGDVVISEDRKKVYEELDQLDEAWLWSDDNE